MEGKREEETKKFCRVECASGGGSVAVLRRRRVLFGKGGMLRGVEAIVEGAETAVVALTEEI